MVHDHEGHSSGHLNFDGSIAAGVALGTFKNSAFDDTYLSKGFSLHYEVINREENIYGWKVFSVNDPEFLNLWMNQWLTEIKEPFVDIGWGEVSSEIPKLRKTTEKSLDGSTDFF